MSVADPLLDAGAWARTVLFGTTLGEKLTPPGEWARLDTGPALPIPEAPGRPAGLAPSDARVAFPGEQDLVRPEARGVVLHFFANHELLAAELMALALLRFPEAPEAFRRGLVRIVAEEQRHLARYLARMGDYGVAFGDVPVNRFFWTALSGATDPRAFIAGLALTFEQANLDHAGWWAGAFRRVGDEQTAAALDEVLRDEIGHVAHGVRWFDRWRDPTVSRWDAWAEALPAPLTPARGKGPGFSRRARLDAGLDGEWIARLAVFGASKGRPPVVHLFEPGVEEALAGAAPGPAADKVAADLAPLMIFLAATDDVVLVPRVPTVEWLAGVADAGFTLPELVPWDGRASVERALGGRLIGGVAPWARSPRVAALTGVPWDPALTELFAKTWSVEHLAEIAPGPDVGVVVDNLAAVDALLAGGGDKALKAPLATAGRGVRRARAGDGAAREWARGVLERQGRLVVEPWLDRVADLSLQFDVGSDGRVEVERFGRFLTDGRGRYLGAVLGRPFADLGPEVARFAHGEGREPDRVQRALADVARALGPPMAARGFTGPAGLDAMIHRRPDGSLAIKPLVELNPRVTMGRIALALQRHLRGGRAGLWRQWSIPELRAQGVRDVGAWARELTARHPLRTYGAPPLLDGGILFTSDPSQASLLVSAVAVAPTLTEARALLGEVSG